MIIYKNGARRTAPYEELRNNVSVLFSRTAEYRNHLNFICADIHRKFELLRNDYENGLIDKDVLKEFTLPLKKIIANENYVDSLFTKLQKHEIVAFLKKHKLL